MDELVEQLPPDWVQVLRDELKLPYWVELEQFVATERTQKEVYPAPEITFAAFKETPFKKVRVVILGQDPTPIPGTRRGWRSPFRQGIAHRRASPTSTLHSGPRTSLHPRTWPTGRNRVSFYSTPH